MSYILDNKLHLKGGEGTTYFLGTPRAHVVGVMRLSFLNYPWQDP
jgi:hypothetical protein